MTYQGINTFRKNRSSVTERMRFVRADKVAQPVALPVARASAPSMTYGTRYTPKDTAKPTALVDGVKENQTYMITPNPKPSARTDYYLFWARNPDEYFCTGKPLFTTLIDGDFKVLYSRKTGAPISREEFGELVKKCATLADLRVQYEAQTPNGNNQARLNVFARKIELNNPIIVKRQASQSQSEVVFVG